jgi:hypothetical protein
MCAYLRMPFSPTAGSKPEHEATEDSGEPGAESGARTDAGDAWRQERQVRLTAQRIFADQCSADPPSTRFWPDIRLDLVGATFFDFDLKTV